MQNWSSVLSVGFGLKIEMMFVLLVLGATAPRERFSSRLQKNEKAELKNLVKITRRNRLSEI